MNPIKRGFWCSSLCASIFLAGCAQPAYRSATADAANSSSSSVSVAANGESRSPGIFRLEQKNGWRLNLTLEELPNGTIKPGKHEFSRLGCGGNYQFEKRESDGRVILRQNITYGNCVQNCQLILAKDYESYQEVCSDRKTGGGAFEKRKLSSTNTDTALKNESQAVQAGGAYYRSNEVTWRICEIGKVFDMTKRTCIGDTKKFTWVDAIAVVNRLNKEKFEGFSDWRMPNSQDLRSLIFTDANVRSEFPRYLSYSRPGGFEQLRACTFANDVIRRTFTGFGQGRGFYDDQHWLTDNNPDGWQEPISFNFTASFGMNYHGYCNILSIATKDVKPQELRAHAEAPVVIVRGGDDSNWLAVQPALKMRAKILANSEADGKSSMKFYNDMIGGVVKWVRENSGKAEDSNASREVGEKWRVLSSKSISRHDWVQEIRIKCTRSGREDPVYRTKDGRFQIAGFVGYQNHDSLASAANILCN